MIYGSNISLISNDLRTYYSKSVRIESIPSVFAMSMLGILAPGTLGHIIEH